MIHLTFPPDYSYKAISRLGVEITEAENVKTVKFLENALPLCNISCSPPLPSHSIPILSLQFYSILCKLAPFPFFKLLIAFVKAFTVYFNLPLEGTFLKFLGCYFFLKWIPVVPSERVQVNLDVLEGSFCLNAMPPLKAPFPMTCRDN